MFRDESVVKKGFLMSIGVLFFSLETPETNELMIIASGEVNTILFPSNPILIKPKENIFHTL